MKKKIRLLFSAILVLFMVMSIGYGQSRNIDKRLKGLDSFIKNIMEESDVPGIAIAIIEKDQIVYIKGYGFRDLEKKLPVTENTLFAIGSATKAMTSTVLCQLVDEGKLDLDLPVKRYIPSFKMYDDYVTEHLTARDLLCHRSGLPKHDLVWYGSERSREELFITLQYLEPSTGFRERYQYQNLMFMTAGYLAGYITGQTWEQLVQNKLFAPLGMTFSNLSVFDSRKNDDFSYPYDKSDGNIKRIPFRNSDAIGPAGSVNSCVLDMSNWLIMQVNGGEFREKQIISEKMLKETHLPHIVVSSVPSGETSYIYYGLGWGISSYKGHLRIHHYGGIDGFTSNVAIMPDDSVGAVVLTNLNGYYNLPTVIMNTIMDRMLGLDKTDWNKWFLEQENKAMVAAKKWEQVKDTIRIDNTNPSHEMSAYAGEFRHPGYGIIEISCQDGKLLLNYHAFKLELKHYHYDTFKAEDEMMGEFKFLFHTNRDGKIDKISAPLERGVSDIIFERIKEF